MFYSHESELSPPIPVPSLRVSILLWMRYGHLLFFGNFKLIIRLTPGVVLTSREHGVATVWYVFPPSPLKPLAT